MRKVQKKENPTVVGIGELLWDILPEGRRLGGAPANFAYHASMQGANAYLVSSIGNDVEGEDILVELEKKSLSSEYVSLLPFAKTGTVSVKLKNGSPSYIINSPVAWDFIPPSEKLASLAAKADAVCFGSLAQRNNISAETIKHFVTAANNKCLKVFDVNLRQNFFTDEIIDSSLKLCNILKISDEELPVVCKIAGISETGTTAINAIINKYNLKWAVMTEGAKGSLFCDGVFSFHIPSCPHGPIEDTVGCGDSFIAVLTVGLLKGFPPLDAMTNASKVAGFISASKGPTPAINEDFKF